MELDGGKRGAPGRPAASAVPGIAVVLRIPLESHLLCYPETFKQLMGRLLLTRALFHSLHTL